MSKKSAGAFIGGLLVGGVLGTLTGLLIAPRTGRDTRQLLKKSTDALPDLAEDLSTTVQLQANRLSGSALRNWDETLTRLRAAINAGREASAKTRDELNSSQSDAVSESHSSISDHQV